MKLLDHPIQEKIIIHSPETLICERLFYQKAYSLEIKKIILKKKYTEKIFTRYTSSQTGVITPTYQIKTCPYLILPPTKY